MLLPLSDLHALVSDMGGEVKFDTPCTVKLTPHSAPTKIHSIEINNGYIYVNETVVLDKPSNIVNTLIQRLRLLKHESIQRDNRKTDK